MRRAVIALLLLALVLLAQIREPRPGFNLFTKEQDIQLGKEAAAQIEKEFQVIDNGELQAYVDSIGSKLKSSRRTGDYPYYFKVVHDDSINAFALPGGPMYIHTGLIKAAENEAQLAGVMGHEISHIALRHGTNQASRANLIQLPALLGAKAAGGGMLGGLAQLGIGLGANSLLLNYSRSAETQADTLGTLILSDAGYNPIEMARFFEKLGAESGARSGRMAEFFSSHPNPGNRMRAVESLVRQLPKQQWSSGDDARLGRAQAIVYKMPAPKPRQQQQQQQQQQRR